MRAPQYRGDGEEARAEEVMGQRMLSRRHSPWVSLAALTVVPGILML